jgi:kumamolisin
VAPGAQIAVYFAPNTDRGFADALTKAVHDPVRKPSIVSISWGGPEDTWSDQARAALEAALQDAAMLGVTVCVAAGDNGSSDGETDGAAHVDFPASSPYVLACGGTSVQAAGDAITAETVWNDLPNGGATGGGVSAFFGPPSWQPTGSVTPGGQPGRGVPDVSGDADPNTGYPVLVDGQAMVIGGTSAVAPLWAGLVARLNQAMGKPLGYLNPVLYQKLSTSLRDIVEGQNGLYAAGPGWDACTGLGSPDGTKLLAALSAA